MKETDLLVRNMRRDELDLLVDWAAAEGWNPGLHDAGIFWDTDPQAFIAAELGGELVGGGSIVNYGGRYGFMGFFIVNPAHRGRGLGNRLWHERLQRLVARLQPGAAIGMDGVYDMQGYYARGGFRFSGRELRFEGRAQAGGDAGGAFDLAEIGFDQVDAYDRRHFPAARSAFLRRWIDYPQGFARGVSSSSGGLAGFAVLRPCRNGFKIGPLFADDAASAGQLFRALCSEVPGEPVFLDVPELNAAALELVRGAGMTEVFGCAKMYHGPAPVLPQAEIFGVTTFELG